MRAGRRDDSLGGSPARSGDRYLGHGTVEELVDPAVGVDSGSQVADGVGQAQPFDGPPGDGDLRRFTDGQGRVGHGAHNRPPAHADRVGDRGDGDALTVGANSAGRRRGLDRLSWLGHDPWHLRCTGAGQSGACRRPIPMLWSTVTATATYCDAMLASTCA